MYIYYYFIHLYMYIYVYIYICARFATPHPPPPGILSRPPVVVGGAVERAVGRVGGVLEC